MIEPEEDNPTDWFEPLYSQADDDGSGVPWVNMSTHPSFQAWLDKNELDGSGMTALVVGCGMGDDAVELESRGFAVTAFDVSESAIGHCRRRFPDSSVDFRVANLFDPNELWDRAFDFVLEIYTIQALPPKFEADIIPRIANFVGENGRLVTVAIVSEEARSFDNGPPWPLTPAHVDTICSEGLAEESRMVREAASKSGNDVWVTTFRRPV